MSSPKPSHLVFVYGTLKRGEGNHSLLKKSELLSVATTCFKFRMFHVGFPVLMPEIGDGRQVGNVRGEVYRIDEAVLRRLDGLESEGHMYKRVKIDVTTESGELLEVQTYIGMQDFWDQRGIGGKQYGRSVQPTDGILDWSRKTVELAICAESTIKAE